MTRTMVIAGLMLCLMLSGCGAKGPQVPEGAVVFYHGTPPAGKIGKPEGAGTIYVQDAKSGEVKVVIYVGLATPWTIHDLSGDRTYTFYFERDRMVATPLIPNASTQPMQGNPGK